MSAATGYVVVPAPGCYGDGGGTVLSAHQSRDAAVKAARRAGKRYVARVGAGSAGDRWLRVYEETYPLLDDVSKADIEALRDEAGAAGDLDVHRRCVGALNGSASDWRLCAAVIRDARAQVDA